MVILVVGTRGDVQTFLAMEKRLQEFGHHVRFATHLKFRDFVKSAAMEFYPLGGDPRVLAGCKNPEILIVKCQIFHMICFLSFFISCRYLLLLRLIPLNKFMLENFEYVELFVHYNYADPTVV